MEIITNCDAAKEINQFFGQRYDWIGFNENGSVILVALRNQDDINNTESFAAPNITIGVWEIDEAKTTLYTELPQSAVKSIIGKDKILVDNWQTHVSIVYKKSQKFSGKL